MQEFVPKLRKAFAQVNASSSRRLMVLYVPSDTKEDQYNDFVAAQPWLALPFRTPLKPQLSRK